MNAKFKPLGLVAAVAAATVGYTNLVNAQPATVGASDLGNLALIPYYTVRDGNVTGVHITNTSGSTQVVKVRLRRGTDSMDALDFNLILSPQDVWTGFLAAEGDDIVFNTTDNSCTAPATVGGKFTMVDIYREDADEGYIEIIGMGQPAVETQSAIAATAKHGANGVPASCALVRDNFFANGVFLGLGDVDNARGVVNGGLSVQRVPVLDETTGLPTAATTLVPNQYVASENALKVSYFIRDAAGGREFGNSATHIENFLFNPAITNQQFGLFSGDLLGFDYPDLNGGVPGGERGRFTELRGLLGNASVINDWSANADLNVGTDWVITFPGQYTMLNLPHYFLSDQTSGAIPCNTVAESAAFTGTDPQDVFLNSPCDFRDIPAVAEFAVYDREEQTPTPEAPPEGQLVVSPALPTAPGVVPRILLPYEVNVVQWGAEPVLGSANSDISVSAPYAFGWAELNVSSGQQTLQVCDANQGSSGLNLADPDDVPAALGNYLCSDAGVFADAIPKIGFVAWERSFPASPDANYGRIVEHSYGSVVN